jgi:phytoene dehydrogenase-like protein
MTVDQSDIRDAVVVGGGLAGLTAAAYLARDGLAVEVLERASHMGGRAATETRDGFSFNRGAHALLVLGEGREVLAELGVKVSGKTPPYSGFALRKGKLHSLPTGALSLMTTGVVGWSDKAALARWLGKLPKLRPDDHANVPVKDWLDSTGAGPAGRELLNAYVRVATYTNQPETLSAATAIRQLQRGFAGNVLYVDGGWQTLADGLARVAMSNGARITPGARVVSLAREGIALTRVQLADGSSVRARAVVLAVEPANAAALIESTGSAAPAGFHNPTVPRAATLDIALERLPRPDVTFVMGVDRPLYFSVHSAVAALAPPGKAFVHTIKYLTGEEGAGGDPAADRRELEALLDLVQPGWRELVVHSQYLPRMAVMERLDRADEGGARGRPTPELDALSGIYVAGDWVQGGGWLCDSAFGSARRAAAAVSARAGLSRNVA